MQEVDLQIQSHSTREEESSEEDQLDSLQGDPEPSIEEDG